MPQEVEPMTMPLVELVVPIECLLARLTTFDHHSQLTADGQSEVQGCADSLGRCRQAMARAVATEEDAVFGARPQPVRDPVALIAIEIHPEVAGELHGWRLHADLRVE